MQNSVLAITVPNGFSIEFTRSSHRKAGKMRQVNHIPAVVLFIAFTLTTAWPGGVAYAADPAFQVVEGRRQLFLDDHGVGSVEGLGRTMHQPEKWGAVVKPDRPWEMSLQTRCVPAWDEKEKIFKL